MFSNLFAVNKCHLTANKFVYALIAESLSTLQAADTSQAFEYVFIRFRPLSRSFYLKHINYARICKMHCKSYNELCDNHKIKQTK